MSNGERDLVALGRLVAQAQGTEKDKPFARRAGISPELLWQIKNARRRDNRDWGGPTAPNVQAVARAAGIPEDKALRLAGYNPDHYITPVDDGAPLMSEAVLAAKICGLGTAERRAMETLVLSMEQRQRLQQQVDRILREEGYIAADAPRLGEKHPERHAFTEAGHAGVESHGEFGTPTIPDPEPAPDDARQTNG